MLSKVHLQRYAEVLLWGLKIARNKTFKKGDVILVRYHIPALPLAEILYARLMEMGMNPVMRLSPTPNMEKSFYMISNRRQLTFQPPGKKELYRNLNGSIFLHAPESITHLSKIDPKKIGSHTLALKPLRDIIDRRESQGLFSWTLCMLPTSQLAKHAGLSMKSYTDQIVKACWLHRRNPVSHWNEIYKEAQQVKKWLNRISVKHYRVESKNVDLVVTPGAQRRWIGISGHNIPSFELFLSPDWRGTNGIYYADQPSYRNGNLVKDVRLEFQKGSAVAINATKGEAFLRKQLGMDNGANKLGEFSLTDKRFSKINRFMANTLYDENYGGRYGNCHVAVGASYSDTYRGKPSELTKARRKQLGFNDSALHWDLVNTEKKRVTAHLKTGRIITIYENGQFSY
jgi:aminopeptidase